MENLEHLELPLEPQPISEQPTFATASCVVAFRAEVRRHQRQTGLPAKYHSLFRKYFLELMKRYQHRDQTKQYTDQCWRRMRDSQCYSLHRLLLLRDFQQVNLYMHQHHQLPYFRQRQIREFLHLWRQQARRLYKVRKSIRIKTYPLKQISDRHRCQRSDQVTY